MALEAVHKENDEFAELLKAHVSRLAVEHYSRGYADGGKQAQKERSAAISAAWHDGYAAKVCDLDSAHRSGFAEGVAYALANLEAGKPKRPGRPKASSVSRRAILAALADGPATVADIFRHAAARKYPYTPQAIRKQAMLMAEAGELLVDDWPRMYAINPEHVPIPAD